VVTSWLSRSNRSIVGPWLWTVMGTEGAWRWARQAPGQPGRPPGRRERGSWFA
jgi:hypothetical protein